MSETRAMIPRQGMLLLASLVLWPVLLVEGATSPLEQAATKNPLHRPGQTAEPASITLPEGLRQTLRSRLQVIEPEGEAPRAYRTLNVGQDLSIRFEQSGIRVTPRQGKGAWQWGMALSGYGYLGDMEPVKAAVMRTEGNRIEYRRGNLVEWYVNEARGLEQGFTLASPPKSGQAANKPLVLEFALSGGLRPLPDKDGLGIRFTDKHGRAELNYTGLQAFDAEGRTLVARLTVQSARLRIEVEDRQAIYPITVDPWIQQAKLLAGDGAAGHWFGYSAALSGDTAIIGAPHDDDLGTWSGSTYVFVRDPATGVWSQQAKLLAGDGAAYDQFGSSTALSNDTALIGAYLDDDLGSNSGSAYVFVRDPATGVWSQQAKLLAGDGAAYDQFGSSTALSSDTALIAGTGDDDLGSNSGSTYVFVRSGITWSQQAKLLAGDGAASDFFGYAVALSSDTALIGAVGDDDLGSWSGSAYVFVRSGNTWSQQTKLLAGDGAADDYFGNAVALSNNTALIGTLGDDDLGANSGSAYVFVRSGNTWSQHAKPLASDGATGDYFGYTVALSGNTALIGAIGDDDLSFWSGSAYVFLFQSTGTIPPQVANIDSVNDSGDGAVAEGEQVEVSVTQILVAFDQDVADPAGDGATNDVTNPANYLLVEAGTNASFDTVSCSGGTVADDSQITVNSASYSSGAKTATISINGGTALGNGSYRLHVCGTTSIENGDGYKLDGDGDGTGGDDFVRNFSVLDTDGDGIPDGEDTDDDNDGAPDTSEIANGTDPKDANDWPQPFADVTNTHAAYTSSLVLSDAGIVTGCGSGNFCPEMIATRDLAAIWLIKAVEGSAYTPPGATGTVFNDIAIGDFNADWIEDLSAHQITGGCGAGNYCPKQAVTKDQIAPTLLRARYGGAYAPPAATGGVYTDVGIGDFNAAWIEDMGNKGFAEGCGGGNYCPEEGLTLAGFANLLARTFGLAP